MQMLTHNMDDLKLTIHEPSNFENPLSTYDDFDQRRICIGDDCSLKVLKNADKYIEIDDSIAEELIGMQHAYKAFSDEIETYTTYSLSCLKIFVVEPKDASSSLQLQVRSNRPPYGENKTAPKKLALIPLKYCRDLFDIIEKGNFRVELNVYDYEHMNIFEIFLRKLMEGLRKMHDAGVYHRDIKAENLSICDGYVKFLDFGFATDKINEYREGTFTHLKKQHDRFVPENNNTLLLDMLASKRFGYRVYKSLIREALENEMIKNGLKIHKPIVQDLYACVITMRYVMTKFCETFNNSEFGFLEAYNHDHDLARLVVEKYAYPMNENLGRTQYQQYNDRTGYGGGNVDQEKVYQYNLEVLNSAKSLRSLIHDDMTAAATVAHDDKDPEFLSSLEEYISHLESRCTTFKSFLKDIHEPQQQVGGGGARDGMMLQKPFRRIKQVISFHVDMLKKIMEELDCDDGGRF